jgi:uncharacterized protein YqgV (UPF0045/DUF77 family)
VSKISAQVSLYPLRQLELGPTIRVAWHSFQAHGLRMKQGAMSTTLWGEEDEVWAAFRGAFDRAAGEGEAVMVTTLSNACPRPRGRDDEPP